jgi:hypothetical protein
MAIPSQVVSRFAAGPARHRWLAALRGLLILAALAGAPAWSAPGRSVEATVESYGETVSRHSGDHRDAPDTLSGVVNLVDDVRLLRQTAIICADLGRSFGLWLDVRLPEGVPVARIETRTEHPPMTAPDGRVSRTQRSEMTSVGGRTYFGWSFDHTWEIVPGLWRMSFHHEGRLLAEKLFEVRAEACYLGS